MRFQHRRAHEIEEGESYYVSMTDLMVGVLFIFIIMLSYFALQFRSTTAELTSAKDAQTTALMQIATDLESKTVTLEVDHQNHIVCVPGQALAENGVSDQARHCFAYSETTKPEANPKATAKLKVEASQAFFMSALRDEISAKNMPGTTNINDGGTVFDADTLFVAGTARLTPEGQSIARQLAEILAQRLPCFGYGAPASDCQDEQKMSGVIILATANFNAFSSEGRAAQALALERSVAFHEALTTLQPVLGKLRTQPDNQGQALLRVATIGNSVETGPLEGSNKSLILQFQMVQ